MFCGSTGLTSSQSPYVTIGNIIYVTACVINYTLLQSLPSYYITDAAEDIEMVWLQVTPKELMEHNVTMVIIAFTLYSDGSSYHIRMTLFSHW